MTDSFRSVAGRYPVLFLDSFGVLKNSAGVISGVPEALVRLKDDGKSIFVVTNDASKPPEKMAEVFARVGHPDLIPEDRFISSGMMASGYLQSQVPYGKVAYLGKPESAHYIEMAGLIPVPIAECKPNDKIVAVILLDDEGYDWYRDINTTLNLIRRIEVPVIIANVDATYPVNDTQIAFAVGSLGALVENITERTFVRFGKPDAMMFAYAFERAQQAHPGLDKADVLFVGDTLRTDIVGANQFGLDTVLVLCGNTLPEQAEALIQSTGITPTYVCDSILT